MRSRDSKNHLGDGLVFACNSHLVNGPQGVIPSLVRLEAAKKRQDFFAKPWARLAYSFGEIGLAPSKGKISLCEFFASNRRGSVRNGIDSVVKSSPKVFDSIIRKIGKRRRKPAALCFQFENIVRSIRVRIGNEFVWLSSDKLKVLSKLPMCVFARLIRCRELEN